MTLHIVDVSRHQVERPDPLNLEDARNVGVDIVNVQLDRGRQADVLMDWAVVYAGRARGLGLEVSTYRWLDNRLPGAESARRAYDRIVQLGGPQGMCHTVDCEDNATETILRDYVHAMTDLLQRPIAIYSGDWWLEPRGWRTVGLSPYLWAAPSAGYLPGYPGDTSPHWTVGYGGYTHLSAMQYAVQPLPGTGNCSLSAIRDPGVWAALTGAPMANPNPDRITAPLWSMWEQLEALEPGSQLGGIYANKRGYHNTRAANQANWPGDYSIRDAEDKAGPADKAAALDWTFPEAHGGNYTRISKYCKRLMSSGKDKNDPRLDVLREWYGQADTDSAVEGWDCRYLREVTSDASHLWHIHFSFDRGQVTSYAAVDAVLSVLRGEPLAGWRARQSLTGGDFEMIKVIAVQRADQTHYYGWVAGRPLVSIRNGDELEAWRALARGALQPTDLSVPDELLAAWTSGVDVQVPGGEQLAGIVANAVDSRIDAIARAVVDEDHRRSAE